MTEPTTQANELRRVEQSIADVVLQFVKSNPRFRAEELRLFVENHRPGAPGSADRILRLLRAQKKLNYRVVSRTDSLYEVVL